MSNVYDYIPPEGVSPLARIIRSQIPDTSSPETPEPLPTPSGGLPAGAPTGPYAPSGIGSLLGNIGSGLAGLARSYFAAGQPSVWGQPGQSGAQQVDESGMVVPQEPPQTTAQATSQDPAQTDPGAMRPPGATERIPRPGEWPPSPIQPKPPETTGGKPADPDQPPPEPTRTTPRQEKFIPTRRDSHPSGWGRPDFAMQGAIRYPGVVPGPFMPQAGEWPGIINGASQFLGSLGSGVIAPLAKGMAMFSNEYWVSYRAQQRHKAQMALSNFQLYTKQLAMKQAQESRDYGDAFAAYGPRTENGKFNPGDEDALRNAILTIAANNNDDRIPAVLARGGIPAVQRLLQERNAHGQDVAKMYTQMLKQQQYYNAQKTGREKDLRIRKLEREEAAARQQLEGYGAGGATVAPAPGAGGIPIPPKPEPEPGEKEREWPTETTAPPETTSTTPSGGDEDTEDREAAATPETKTAAAEPEKTPPEDEERPKSPSEELLAKAEGAQTPSGAAPTRLAAAETPTKTDAGPQRAEPPAAEMPEWLKRAREGSQPSGAPAPAGQVVREAPGAAAEPPREYKPERSKALDAARNFVNPYTGQPMPLDEEGVNTRARGIVNGTIKTVQGQKEIPAPIKNIDRMRANELEAALDHIIADPKIKGDEVYKAISQQALNPELSADLRAYVNGDVAVPSGSWNNLNFLKRIIALGQKVDPTFNTATFAVRARTKQSYANGADARNWTSVATLYLHAQEGIDLLKEIERQNPGAVKEYLGASKLGTQLRKLGIGPSPEQQKLFARLDTVLGTVATEYVRATSGAAPTVTHRNEVHHGLDYKWNEESSVISQLQQMRVLAEDRMKILAQRYNTVLGEGAKKDPLAQVLSGYAQGATGGRPQLEGKGSEGSGGYASPSGDALGGYANPNDPRMLSLIQRFTGSQNPRDQEAIDWARQNPGDPRARKILERNNAL